MKGLVVCFAGQIGSGKTSVTRLLADALRWKRAAFGDYLRNELVQRGVTASRDALQDLGQSLVDIDPEDFTRRVLASADFKPGSRLLIDGVRHVQIFRNIQRLALPSETKLLYLAADSSTRVSRIASRGSERTNVEDADKHPVESELKSLLRAIADNVIDATAPLDTVLQQTLDAIAEWDGDPSTIAQAYVFLGITRGVGSFERKY